MRAGAVAAVVELPQRFVDLVDHPVGVLLERIVDLAIDHIGRVIGEVLVAAGGVELAVFVVVVDEVLGRGQQACAQRKQLLSAGIDVNSHVRSSAAASLRSASSSVNPSTSTTLLREACPATTRTARFARPRDLGEQLDDGSIRLAALGRCSNTDPPRIAVTADDLGPACARRDAQAQTCDLGRHGP